LSPDLNYDISQERPAASYRRGQLGRHRRRPRPKVSSHLRIIMLSRHSYHRISYIFLLHLMSNAHALLTQNSYHIHRIHAHLRFPLLRTCSSPHDHHVRSMYIFLRIHSLCCKLSLTINAITLTQFPRAHFKPEPVGHLNETGNIGLNAQVDVINYLNRIDHINSASCIRTVKT
jgi:hypothetical protein